MNQKTRGFYGVAFFEPKVKENLGIAMRSAMVFNAAFVAVIGARYTRVASDTVASTRHVPLFHYTDMADFLSHVPAECQVIAVECDATKELETFEHPERAIYLLGGEDKNLPTVGDDRIRFNTEHCVNMAVAASIVMYDRQAKAVR